MHEPWRIAHQRFWQSGFNRCLQRFQFEAKAFNTVENCMVGNCRRVTQKYWYHQRRFQRWRKKIAYVNEEVDASREHAQRVDVNGSDTCQYFAQHILVVKSAFPALLAEPRHRRDDKCSGPTAWIDCPPSSGRLRRLKHMLCEPMRRIEFSKATPYNARHCRLVQISK